MSQAKPWLDWAALLGFCGFIFMLSDQPSVPLPSWFEHQDKLNHFAAYSVMAALAWRAFRHQITHKRLLILLCVVFCSLYGVSDEWHQSFVPGREVSAADWVADTLGALFAVTVVSRWLKDWSIFALNG